MRFNELREASLVGTAARQLTRQLELPLEPAVKAVAKPVSKRVEYWGYLPGETATSRPFFRQTFNSEEEAQAWMNRRNATPQGSRTIDEASLIGRALSSVFKGAEKEAPRIEPTMGRQAGTIDEPYKTPKPRAVSSSPFRGLIDAAERAGVKLVPLAGGDKIVQIAGRPIVVVDVGGRTIPFYVSTGGGGKAGVPTGKWYPFFGIGPNGFFNKGWEEAQINSYYGSQKLAQTAQTLDQTFGNVIPHTRQMNPGGPALGQINNGLDPVSYSVSQPFTREEFKAYEKYINGIVASL